MEDEVRAVVDAAWALEPAHLQPMSVEYHVVRVVIEIIDAVARCVDAAVLSAMADDDGWITSGRSGGSVDITGDVGTHYSISALHMAASVAHVRAARAPSTATYMHDTDEPLTRRLLDDMKRRLEAVPWPPRDGD